VQDEMLTAVVSRPRRAFGPGLPTPPSPDRSLRPPLGSDNFGRPGGKAGRPCHSVLTATGNLGKIFPSHSEGPSGGVQETRFRDEYTGGSAT
jgi:hypothetical protein